MSCVPPVVIRAVEGASSDAKLRHFLDHFPPVGLTEQSFPVLSNDLQVYRKT